MSHIPDEIEGLGSVRRRLRQNPGFDLSAHAVTSEDYFVWSRLDGNTSTRDVILMTGFPVDKVIAILRELRRLGAVLLPGETAASVAEIVAAARAPSAEPAAESSGPSVVPGAPGIAAQLAANTEQTIETGPPAAGRRARTTGAHRTARATGEHGRPRALSEPGEPRELVLEEPLAADEMAALAEPVALAEDSKRRILAMRRLVGAVDHFALLGVGRDADKRAIKRAYFRLSKEFHPDRHYGVDTGSFEAWLSEIFEAIVQAFELLSDGKQRQRYEAALDGRSSPAAGAGQTRAEYAAELFARACDAETHGQIDDALALFAATLRMDPLARYLRRAASCATAAGAQGEAIRWAREAVALEPENPSAMRLLAGALAAGENLADAEDVLVRALALRTENDVLAGELAADLAAVRARRGA